MMQFNSFFVLSLAFLPSCLLVISNSPLKSAKSNLPDQEGGLNPR